MSITFNTLKRSFHFYHIYEKVQIMMTVFITILILLQLSVKVFMQICYGIIGIKCCYGFKWDSSQSKCIPCEYGFFGRNCDSKCRYPMYGKNCLSVCKCDVLNCDYVNGCTQPTTNYKVQSTLHTNDKTVTKEQIEIYDVSSIKGFSNVLTVATNSINSVRESKHEMINTILFGMIGLAAVLLIIYMIYIYTIALEKRLVYTAPI